MNRIKLHKNWILIVILLIASILRLYKLDTNPPSMFGDELEVGYQAYSILKTGKDYYGNFMPVEFHSIAEWRTPLYLYSSVPTVAIFGISPLGVRLPAALFGIIGIYGMYIFLREFLEDERVALIGSFLLAISPWHIQYSRAGFEVTELIALLLFALYFFLDGVKNRSKDLILSAFFFGLLPWIYNTAKLFTPVFVFILVVIYRKKLANIDKKLLLASIVTLILVAAPIAWSSIYGGGAERFNYLSIFSGEKIEATVGEARSYDSLFRTGKFDPLTPSVTDRLFHNKFVFWGSSIFDNYLNAISPDFLFVNGDPNPRHSPQGIGQFFNIEIIALFVGIMTFAAYKSKVKILLLGWIMAGILPAALTQDGGNHATRLVLILPPLVVLIALGINSFIKAKHAIVIAGSYLFVLTLLFISYVHIYYVHYPYQSEVWWHAGYREAFVYVDNNQNKYDRVVISTAKEPPWIFFAAWMHYPPDKWQREFPLDNKVSLDGFGEVSHIDKYFFGSPHGQNIYEWGKVLDSKTLYLASSDEVKLDLKKEPERTPADIKLLYTVTYPSGAPAFYLFTGTHEI